MAALKAGQAGGGDKRGMQSAALLVVRKNGGYLGANDRFIDIRVYDAPDPIAELERLLALHKLHFFPSRAEDLVPITPGDGGTAGADPPARAGQSAREVAEGAAGQRHPSLPGGAEEFMYWENYDVRVRMDGKIDHVVLARHPEQTQAVGDSSWPPPRSVRPEDDAQGATSSWPSPGLSLLS